MKPPARVRVLNSNVSVCDADAALKFIGEEVVNGSGGYVCFTNVHTAVMACHDEHFRTISNDSLLSVADGRPVYWVGRVKVGRQIGHVPGPDFFFRALKQFAAYPHFFYGSTQQVLDRLGVSLRQAIPELNICGMLSPPFRSLTEKENQEHYQRILESGAKFVWVGLGAPKQEQWMAKSWERLAPCILFGVGAAYDFHAGTVRRAPLWMQQSGLEWLYRLLMEPRRLWRRYFVTNSLFIFYVVREMLKRTVIKQHAKERL